MRSERPGLGRRSSHDWIGNGSGRTNDRCPVRQGLRVLRSFPPAKSQAAPAPPRQATTSPTKPRSGARLPSPRHRSACPPAVPPSSTLRSPTASPIPPSVHVSPGLRLPAHRSIKAFKIGRLAFISAPEFITLAPQPTRFAARWPCARSGPRVGHTS